MVTSIGLVLVIAACYLFLNGHYLAGLLAGWIMTFLDTVDGKLARVTVQSTQVRTSVRPYHRPGSSAVLVHLLGHVPDRFAPVLGFDQQQMYWLIIIAYVLAVWSKVFFHCWVIAACLPGGPSMPGSGW